MITKDLINRLRDTASKGVSVWGDLQMEAAKEIETLLAERECYASAMDRMQAALAEPSEPVATIEISERGSSRTIDTHFAYCVRDWPCGEYELFTHPAKPEPSEPVAWSITYNGEHCGNLYSDEFTAKTKCASMNAMWLKDTRVLVPLFTHPASNQLDEIAKVLHYPDCWDVMAYPTLEDAIIEAKSWAHCTNDDCQCPTKEA